MNLRENVVTFGLALLSLTAIGCGSSDDEKPKCEPPSIEGTPFGFQGSATVHGTGMIPAGASPDGADLELLVNTGSASYGVLPMNLFDEAKVCGQSFTFKIDQMEAGTYRLDYEIRANSADTNPSATGTSTNAFTVTDGADVEFDPVF